MSEIINYNPDEADLEAIGLVLREKTAWENKDVVVSDSVNYSMRTEIDENRKNYFGVYQEPVDTDTQLAKLWIPLSEWTVESIVKDADPDTKDITIKAPPGKKSDVAQLIRLVTLHFLKVIGWGEFLNASELRQSGIASVLSRFEVI